MTYPQGGDPQEAIEMNIHLQDWDSAIAVA